MSAKTPTQAESVAASLSPQMRDERISLYLADYLIKQEILTSKVAHEVAGLVMDAIAAKRWRIHKDSVRCMTCGVKADQEYDAYLRRRYEELLQRAAEVQEEIRERETRGADLFGGKR